MVGLITELDWKSDEALLFHYAYVQSCNNVFYSTYVNSTRHINDEV